MSTALLQWQKMMIQNSIITQSHAEIAEFLSIDINLVHQAAQELNPDGIIFTKQMKLDAAKAEREKNKPIKQPRPSKIKKEKQPVIITRKIFPESAGGSMIRKDVRRFPTLQVDYERCLHIKIDSKTHLVIKPGEDAEKKIRLFKRDYKHYFENRDKLQLSEA